MEKFYNVKTVHGGVVKYYSGLTSNRALLLRDKMYEKYGYGCRNVQVKLANPEFPFPMVDSFNFA